MSILRFQAARAATAFALAGLLAACNSTADKPATETTTMATSAATTPDTTAMAATAPAGGTVTQAELMANHQKMVADYRAMASADSVMQADHQRALAAAKSAGIYNTPAFQDLMKRHDAMMTQLQQGITRRQTIMDRQVAMASNQTSGKMTAEQLAQENTAIVRDDQQIQQEHQKLVAEHAQMMAQHEALLKQKGKA